MTSEKAMRELQMLQLTQQTIAAELKEEVAKIGIRIQEQSDRTLLQEQTRKEQQERTTEQLSQMDAERRWILCDSKQLMRRNWRSRHNLWRNLLQQRCRHMRQNSVRYSIQ